MKCLVDPNRLYFGSPSSVRTDQESRGSWVDLIFGSEKTLEIYSENYPNKLSNFSSTTKGK